MRALYYEYQDVSRLFLCYCTPRLSLNIHIFINLLDQSRPLGDLYMCEMMLVPCALREQERVCYRSLLATEESCGSVTALSQVYLTRSCSLLRPRPYFVK